MSRGLWVKVSSDLPRHAKLFRLARRLGISRREAFFYVVNLWLFALNSYPDGHLPPSYDEIAFGCDLDESIDPHNFVDALCFCSSPKAGFLDPLGDNGYQVHDWECFTGALLEQREQVRERVRRYRNKKSLRIGNGDVTHDVTRYSNVTCNECNAEEQEQEQEQEKVKTICSQTPTSTQTNDGASTIEAPQKNTSHLLSFRKKIFENEFEVLWKDYPRKYHSNKQKAKESYMKHRSKGVTFDDFQTAVQAYARYCSETCKSPEYIMMGSTFFGPSGRWKDFLCDEHDVQLEYGGMMEPQNNDKFASEKELIQNVFGGDSTEYAKWLSAGSPEPAREWYERRRTQNLAQ